MEKYHKPAFERISDEKRQRVIEAAVEEFSEKGFSGSNINVISEKAGISIGSMYKYFQSKENLFMAVIDYGYQVLETVLSGIDLESGNIFDKIERMLRLAQKYSREHPKLIQIYLDLSSESLHHLSRNLSRTVESITAEYYRALLNEAKEEGIVARDLDPYITAFCLDNILVILQFSYTSAYYQERMRIFAGDDALVNDEKMISGIMRFIRGALSPR